MALSNYSELKQSIINWSHRSDMDLLIDDFIRLAEVDMYSSTSGHESLEIRAMETSATGTIASNALALPTGFISLRGFRITGDSGWDLRYKTPESMVNQPSTGMPKYYTITTQFEFDKTPDQSYSYEIDYIQKPTGVSSSNTTNITLTNYPNIYLYGALAMLYAHADDEMQAQKYYTRFSDAINGANAETEAGKYGASPYARINGATP